MNTKGSSVKKCVVRLFDIYLEIPVISDVIIVILFSVILYFIDQTIDLKVDKSIVASVNTDLISNSISLVGFVLAALTIIITFKENTKTYDEKQVKRELNKGVSFHFFNSRHYDKTVKVFYGASFELLFIFIASILLKFFIPLHLGAWYNYILVFLVSLMCITVLRCLIILYMVIKLQIGGGKW
ncbi:MAG: hypothetical protein JXR10_17560 [Cyclobacteriaceae bacterium]